MKSRGYLVSIFCALIASILFTSCKEKTKPINGRLYQGLLFGKAYTLDVIGDTTNYQMQIDSITHNFQQLFDVNNPQSIVARYNQFTTIDSAFTFRDTTKVFAIVYDVCRDLYQQTMQYYDPTVMPLKRAWMVAKMQGRTEVNLDSLFEFVGFDEVRTDFLEMEDGQDVLRKTDPRIELDLAPIAQAIAMDHIADFLKSKGVLQFRLQYDRDVITHGYEVDSLNIIAMGITSDSADLKIRMHDAAFSYTNVQDKQRLVDPTNGYPVENEMAYVAVTAPSMAQAKIFAEAFLIMGIEKAGEYYSNHEDSRIHSYMFYRQDETLHNASTNGFDALIIGTNLQSSDSP